MRVTTVCFSGCNPWRRWPVSGRRARAASPAPLQPGLGDGCVSPSLGLLKKGLAREVYRFKWRRHEAETMDTKLSFLLFVQTLPI